MARFSILCLAALAGALQLHAQPTASPSSPNSQPSTTNHVLELDGTNSWVKLPRNIFSDLSQATIEFWAKWERLGHPGWNRAFSYGAAGPHGDLSVANLTGSTLWFVISDATSGGHGLTVNGVLRTNEWVHVAAASGKGGMRLYLNGVLIGTNSYTGSFANLKKSGGLNRIGRTVVAGDTEIDPPFKGEIDDFQVWRVERSEAQIRHDMFEHLTGKEAGLVGLWNFDRVEKGMVKDGTTNGYDGTLVGNAKIVPSPVPGKPFGVVFGTIVDDAGQPVTHAIIHAEVNGEEVAQTASRNNGRYQLILKRLAGAVNLETIVPDKLVGRRSVDLNPTDHWQEMNFKLEPSFHVGGQLTALDGKTPLGNVVVELVRPAGADTAVGRDVLIAPRRAVDSPPYPSSSTTNRALRLTGTNSCYVDLRTNIIGSAQELTFEAWLKPEEFGFYPQFFSIGKFSREIVLAGGNRDDQLILGLQSKHQIVSGAFVNRTNALVLHRWCHVAAVAGTNGLRLYLNGILVGSKAYAKPLFTNDAGQPARLGRARDWEGGAVPWRNG